MSQENTPANAENKSSGGKKALIIIFILLLLGGNGYLIYKKVETEKQHVSAIEGKDALIAKREATLDSLHTVLKLRYDEIAALSGDTASLGQAMRELENEKKKLKRSANVAWSKVKNLEKMKSQYELMLKQQDEELLVLRSASDSLSKYNTALKDTIVKKENEISTLVTEKDELFGQVELAQILTADKFVFSYLDKKDRLKQWEDTGIPTFKSKSVVKLRVDFKLMPNKVALVENKTVYMQIKDPSGNTIYDLALGSGEFTLDDRQEYYTLKEDVLYDTRGKQVTFIYEKGSPFMEGTYKVNIYCEGQQIGSDSFAIK